MKKTVVFCEKCRKYVDYKINEIKATQKLKDTEVNYVEKIATCCECGSEVFIDELIDSNMESLYNGYRKANNIISLEKIKEIPKKYRIGKRPLSLLLGWGELTFTRYYDGYIPSKQYSDLLEEIYKNPSKFLSVLTANKNKITYIAYHKSKEATEELMCGHCVNIEEVADYILHKCHDITHLALQKALYYSQGFYFAFFHEFFFNEDCEAWVHGPVYKEIWKKYADYNFGYIEDLEEAKEDTLNANQKLILYSVIKNFCCYSGKTLEEFTHNEVPWSKTRGELPSNSISTRVIPKSLMCEYFSGVVWNYNMLNPKDISRYSQYMFAKV